MDGRYVKAQLPITDVVGAAGSLPPRPSPQDRGAGASSHSAASTLLSPMSIAEQSDPKLPARASDEGGRRATECMRWRVDSFDHLVGERKHGRRDFQAQRFGGLEVQG